MKRLGFLLFALAFLLSACSESFSNRQAGESTGLPTLARRALSTSAPGLQRATSVSVTPSAYAPGKSVTQVTEPTVTPKATYRGSRTADATVSQAAAATSVAPTRPSPSPSATQQAETISVPSTPGALIGITMQSQVGVLLDEFPPEMRDRVATELREEPIEAWTARAARQIRLTRLQLNFRDSRRPGRGQLPLPPAELWSINGDPRGPQRQTVQGNELMVFNYTLSTTLLADEASVEVAEPALAEIGGVWEEPFAFPVDPDFLLQRGGFACLSTRGFPPNSVDSENAWIVYDFTRSTCRTVLAARIGVVDTVVRFERLPWDATLADQVRVGPVTSSDTAELRVVGGDLLNNRIIYRFIRPGDCALVEGAVGDSGWRRLLQFDATVQNVGGAELHLGAVVTGDAGGGVFEFAPCHDHVHYLHFGEFTLRNSDQSIVSKQAFCVQSTDRYSNNELSPLTHDYSCRFQGIQAGWADVYIAGLDTQWVDITDLEIPDDGATVELGFVSNPNGFLCEGTPVSNAQGTRLWEPSGLTTEAGTPVSRPQCDFASNWEANNRAERNISVPPNGSFVTQRCSGGEIGPLRNCGFTEINFDANASEAVCRAGQRVSLTYKVKEGGSPQVLRVCERSAVLGSGVACTFGDSLANVIIGTQPTAVAFDCPAVRDLPAADGDTLSPSFALYRAPVWPRDPASDLDLVE